MAIKVIREGVAPVKKDPKVIGTCNNCGCQVEALESDCLGSLSEYFVICPTDMCYRFIRMKEIV